MGCPRAMHTGGVADYSLITIPYSECQRTDAWKDCVHTRDARLWAMLE
jgi:hypothetical protein